MTNEQITAAIKRHVFELTVHDMRDATVYRLNDGEGFIIAAVNGDEQTFTVAHRAWERCTLYTNIEDAIEDFLACSFDFTFGGYPAADEINAGEQQ